MKGLCSFGIVFLLWYVIPAGAGVVKNGSFEMDGLINVSANKRPKYWCDVSYDGSKFAAYTYNNWASQGNYSLVMNSYMFSIFEPNDSATISQSVYFDSVNQLALDLYLYSDSGNWNPNIATARVLADNNEIWNSDGLQFTAGQFLGQVVIDVNQNLKDGEPHLLSLQLRIDVSSMGFTQYFSQWDFVRFNYGCRGIPGDFTGDCIVDINDLAVFANGWLKPDGLDLNGDGVDDFADFAVFADLWGVTGEPNSTQPPQDNLLNADLNDDGIVDIGDIVVFSNYWLGDGGSCIRADFNSDGLVDFVDFSIFAKSWRQTGSLYGW